MYEIDFLPVEAEDGPSSKSGDAITIRYTAPGASRPVVIVIDAGFQASGDDVVEHIRRHYDTDTVDLVISTHPDTDHLNGLTTVIRQLHVHELMIHEPRLIAGDGAKNFGNIEQIDQLLDLAAERGIPVTQPFAGVSRFEGSLTVLGPTEAYYKELVEAHLDEIRTGMAAARMQVGRGLLQSLDYLQRKIEQLPIETLTDDVDTGPRNNTSVITLLHLDGKACLFTGDAGIPALEAAAAEYESLYGSFAAHPVGFFQAPHHGSRRNLGPTILNRMFGSPQAPTGTFEAGISSALADEKHPSPKVTNALIRRGGEVVATEGKSVLWRSSGILLRTGWGPATPLGPLAEEDS